MHHLNNNESHDDYNHKSTLDPQMHLMQNNIAPRIFFLIKRDLLANITRNEKQQAKIFIATLAKLQWQRQR